MLDKLKRRLFKGKDSSEGGIENRREPREDVEDGWVEVRGNTYPLKNWSARGFLAGPCDVDVRVASRLDVKVSVPVNDERLEFEARGMVVRCDTERQELACTLTGVDDATQSVINKHFGLSLLK